MLKKTIKAGQILAHSFRMFRQVSANAWKISLCVGLIVTVIYLIYLKDIQNYNFRVLMDFGVFKTKKFIREFAANVKGVQNQRKDFLNYYELNRLILLGKSLATTLAISLSSCYLLVVSFLSYQGQKLAQDNHTNSLIDADKMNKLLKKKKLKGEFVIQLEKDNWLKKEKKLYLPNNFETKHIFVSGSTGSGKTNLLHNLIPQIRQKGQSGIVIDQTLEMTSKYFNPETDIIFNPFDDRTYSWDFFKEVENDLRLKALANTLYTPPGRDMGENSSWYQNAKTLFIDSVRLISNSENPTLQDLYGFLTKADVKTMCKFLEGTKSAGIIFADNMKTSTSLLSVMRTNIEWLEYPTTQKDNNLSFTLKDWVQEARNSNKSRFLFLTTTPSTRKILQPLLSIIMDMAVENLMELGKANNERLWLIIDELAALNKLPILTQSLAELRKYGGCILAATQTMSQIYDIYGFHQANSIYSQFCTKFVFGNNDNNMNELISKELGKDEYSTIQESISYGAHEMRDGVSLAQIDKVKHVVTSSDIARLQPLECFVKLREIPDKVVKIKTKYVSG